LIRTQIVAALATCSFIAVAPIAPRLTFATASAQAPVPVSAAIPKPDAQATAIRRWRAAHETEIVNELSALIALPNNASNATDIRRNAEAIKTMLDKRGLGGRFLENGSYPPAVYGELTTPGASHTIVFYAHYDGQPVTPSEWMTPPFQPTLRAQPAADGSPGVVKSGSVNGRYDPEDRIYGRSASDDKAPIVMLMSAIDAMRAAGQRPSVNVKFFFEGEEEAGSAHLRSILERNKALLAADMWFFCDGPAHASRQLQLVFGVRGTMGLEAKVFGPAGALHSGHYGNWAPNPGILIAELVTSLRDGDGKILVDHFYDDVLPPSAADLDAARALPRIDEELRKKLLLGATEADNTPLAERIMYPALNLHGISVGQVGAQSTNAIPTEATATFDFRLVPDQTPAHIRQTLESYLTQRGWYIVHEAPTPEERLAHARVVQLTWGGGYPAYRTAVDDQVGTTVRRVVSSTIGKDVLVLPMLGGSIGLAEFADVLGVPLITLPTVNHDNSQHAKDENIRLQNVWDGIEVFAGLMTKLGAEWRVVP